VAADDPPPQLAEFVALYGAGRFFDAHEVLEEAWRRSDDPPMPFLQGLIQWAVAFEHHRRGNAHGARVLLERAWSRLRDAPEGFMGLDLRAWRAARPGLAEAFARWEAGGPRPEVRAPPAVLLEADAVSARTMTAARRIVGGRAAAGREEPTLEVEELVAALESDAAARADLTAAETARRSADLVEAGVPSGARALRDRRAAEVHRAVGELVLAGRLVPDGAGRVRLPGFGRTTWRSIALLREGAGGPERLVAEAIAAEPGSDLGDAAPPALRGLRPHPGLLGAARRLHALEALRQDARNGLFAATAALAAAEEAGHADSAAILRGDCAALEARVGELDAAIEVAWAAGVHSAGAIAPRD
jgi:hypothetical protein